VFIFGSLRSLYQTRRWSMRWWLGSAGSIQVRWNGVLTPGQPTFPRGDSP